MHRERTVRFDRSTEFEQCPQDDSGEISFCLRSNALDAKCMRQTRKNEQQIRRRHVCIRRVTSSFVDVFSEINQTRRTTPCRRYSAFRNAVFINVLSLANDPLASRQVQNLKALCRPVFVALGFRGRGTKFGGYDDVCSRDVFRLETLADTHYRSVRR